MASSDRTTVPKVLLAIAWLAFAVALWAVLSSLIFLAGTRLLTQDTVPFLQWWKYFHAYGFGHPVVGLWLKIAAGVPTVLVLLGLVIMLARDGLPGSRKRALHGETRWARRDEMQRAGLYGTFGGLFVGKDSAGRYLRFEGAEHVACYAPTRSGKGVGLVIPNNLLYEASVVTLDVKREAWQATAGAKVAAGQKVYLFDPLAPDGKTARYNPFTYVRRGTLDAFDDIQRIAQMVYPQSGGDQAFWTDSARSAFTGTAAFLAETPEMPLTMGQVLRLLSGDDGAVMMLRSIEARRHAKKPYTEATVKALEDYLRGSADVVNNIRKTVTARLSLWYNPRIDAATAESDFDLRHLRRSLHAIYICVSPDNIARLRPLLALFFQQLVDVHVRTLPQYDPEAKHQVLLLLDEFPLLGPMPMLADAFAHIAGYNVRIMLVMQSKAQLRDRELYGPDGASAILDNCGLEVVFGTKDLTLTEELSARLGYDTVEGTSRSGPRFWRSFRNDRINMTQSDQRRALLLPQEVARLDPSEAILLRPGTYPVRCKRIRYYADPRFKSLVSKPPLVPPIEIDVRFDTGPLGGALPPPANAATPQHPVSPTAPPPAPPPSPAAKKAGGTPARGRKAATKSAPTPLLEPAQADAAAMNRSSVSGAPDVVVQDVGGKGQLAIVRPGGDVAAPRLAPKQSEDLLSSILGANVDMTEYGLEDGKALISAMLAAVPTVESLDHKVRQRA